MNKEEMEQIKLRTGKQLERENYLLLHKSKAQIMNILLNTEEKFEQLQNNWNELKEWLKEIQINGVDIDEWTIIEVRNKVEEIESRK